MGLVDTMSVSDKLYVCQTNVIRDLASKGPCVIVGRCADFILKDQPDCLHIFIHSDMTHRAARVRERYGETSKPMEKRLQEKDSKRKVYYKHYTNRNWGEAENYDVCLDSGTLGVDKCVEIDRPEFLHIPFSEPPESSFQALLSLRPRCFHEWQGPW